MKSAPSKLIISLQEAFDFFNIELFDDRLPECIVMLHRKRGVAGYYWHNTFVEKVKGRRKPKTASEIALDPEHLGREEDDVYSTLVHEMCHLEQFSLGNNIPSNGAYHNSEWVKMMLKVGLIPSDTGEVGGKQTGIRMTHYIEEGGRYQKAFEKWKKKGNSIDWYSDTSQVAAKPKGPKRVTKKCRVCKVSANVKHSIRILCYDCREEMT